MQVGIVGAGAVGGAIAALLSRAGHDVEVTARGEHLEAIQNNGIHLTGAWGEYTARVQAGSVLTRSPELVIVATKAQDAVEAIYDNLRLLRGVPVLVVQNGLDSLTNAKAASPGSDIVGGLASFASSYISPGEINVTAAGPTYLGVVGERDLPARYTAHILDAVMPTSLVPNFSGAQWTKLVVNQINALQAITGLSAQEVIAHPQLRRIMTASMRENVRIAFAGRVRFEKLNGLDNRGLRLFSLLPLWIGQLLPTMMSARMGTVPNPGSTLQSISRGRSTEIDALNGAVVRAAAKLKRVAPINAKLVELVHEVEASGTFLTEDEVVARFER